MAITALSLSGDKQLTKKLERLSRVSESKLARSALIVAAYPIIRAAKQNIATRGASRKRKGEFRTQGKPVSFTGNLRKSIGWRIKQYKRTGVLVLVLGPRWPLGAHGHLIEYGTTARMSRTGFRGVGPALPFLRPAFDQNIGKAQAILQSVVRIGVLKEATRP